MAKRKKPDWCAKPKPCDYDPPTHYCPHRECRANLEAHLERAETFLDENVSTWRREVDPQPET